MPRKQTPHRRGAKGADGLTERERAFVRERRADAGSPGWVIAQRAGYMGDRGKLTRRAGDLMRKQVVATAVHLPDPAQAKEVDDDTLKHEIRKKFRHILNSQGATFSDVIKAGDKLLATIPGGYVPVQVKTEGVFTLEGFVRAMGGAPDQVQRLPSASDGDDET